MKTKLFFLLILALNPLLLLTQIPQGFNYQAIARNDLGNPITNTSLPVTITIQSDSLGGTIFWEELHPLVTTNNFGMFTLVIGKGIKQASSIFTAFRDINWSVPQIYIRTQVLFNSTLLNMGSSRLWSVPYSMTANNLSGPIDRLEVLGKTESLDEALFEVKNKDGQTVFAVYNEGVRIYVDDGAKGVKGGFAVGGFGTDKAEESQKYLMVTKDSIRMYLDINPLTKGKKGGFAVGGYDLTKGTVQNYLDVSADSIRVYVDTNPETKKLKGGFAVGGYDMTKGEDKEYFRVTSDSVKVSKSLLIPRLSTIERDHLPFIPGDALIIFNTTENCMQIYKNMVWSNIWCFNCAPSFIIQPIDKTICSGDNVNFFVSATGTNLNYQWQESIDNGDTWINISNGGSNPTYSGAKTHTLALSSIPVSFNNNKYRCIIIGSCPPDVISNIATLNVGSNPPVISSNPIDQQLSDECTAIFSITAPGYGVSYQWQQSNDGGIAWSHISNGGTSPVYSGSNTSILTLSSVPKTYNDYRFRCVVSNICGGVAISNTAALRLVPPMIIDQPPNNSQYPGFDVTFTITVSGSSIIYRWQESIDGGSNWSNIINGGNNPTYSGANNSILILSKVPLTYNNYKYRCVVSHSCLPDTISDTGTLSVTTSATVTDFDGNIYNLVGIGTQLWMGQNLKVTKYKDGTAIPNVTDSTEWANLFTSGFCWYNNDEATNKDTYGALYNWYTVNTGNLCPTGWHVPSDAELITLKTYLGGEWVAGGKLKETGTTHWQTPNIATNESGFTALPGGCRRYDDGSFQYIGGYGFLWSSTVVLDPAAWMVSLKYDVANLDRSGLNRKYGLSVRCLKD